MVQLLALWFDTGMTCMDNMGGILLPLLTFAKDQGVRGQGTKNEYELGGK